MAGVEGTEGIVNVPLRMVTLNCRGAATCLNVFERCSLDPYIRPSNIAHQEVGAWDNHAIAEF